MTTPKPDRDRAAIEARLAELYAKQEAATSWGAAVGVRHEEIKSLESRLRAMTTPKPAAMTAELLPCPFCGTEPQIICEGDYVTVACPHYYCNFSQIALRNKAKAVARWNTRALPLPEDTGGREWRLVETAPHETYVLLGWWDEGKWNCTAGMASHGWSRNGISTMSCHGQATHWQPLPAGPASLVSSTDHSPPPADYKCENCIGTIEHGCYCKAIGAVAPGGPMPPADEVAK